ncbi:carbohydrate-binding family 9-like protein [Rhodohalobacter sp. 614A]|uniref:carbohydrate-binding family 9-like protein n=1 Tax=Rhodohalobacter sp. 614A TaxID=2908649 RepID=UPI001F1ECF63|nr:carbohydrate-binding family 9-like protein [Rhodohalobacter sp. 614A]
MYIKPLGKKLSVFGLCGILVFISLETRRTFAFQGKNFSSHFSPETYVIHKTQSALTIDGILDETAWKQANWTDPFLDIQGDHLPTPRFETKAKMLWNADYLYLAAQLEEPHLWATIDERDAVIFMENNFEIFIDPDGDTHHYYELEVNALGTFWDLMLTQPYRTGGKPLNAWDIKGLEIGLDIRGTLNDPSDTDVGWTIEIAIPLTVLNQTIRGNQPRDGSQWRLNFSRVEWLTDVENGKYIKRINSETGRHFPEDNWVWSPQGVIDMHLPERWGIVQFSEEPPRSDVLFVPSEEMDAERLLRELYYRQRAYRAEHGKYAESITQLNAAQLFEEFDFQPDVKIQVLGNAYIMQLTVHNLNHIFYIREDSRTWKELKN